MSELVKHAQKELELAGLFDEDSDYDGALGKSVIELIRLFASQGHSGVSAGETIKLFNDLANFGVLTPIGSTKDEWMELVAHNGGVSLYQNKRRLTTFSRDGGKTWYDIDNAELDNGDTFGNRVAKGEEK